MCQYVKPIISFLPHLMNLHDFATFNAVHACDTDDFFTIYNAYIFTTITALHKSRQFPLFRYTSNVVLDTLSFLSYGELNSGKKI